MKFLLTFQRANEFSLKERRMLQFAGPENHEDAPADAEMPVNDGSKENLDQHLADLFKGKNAAEKSQFFKQLKTELEEAIKTNGIIDHEHEVPSLTKKIVDKLNTLSAIGDALHKDVQKVVDKLPKTHDEMLTFAVEHGLLTGPEISFLTRNAVPAKMQEADEGTLRSRLYTLWNKMQELEAQRRSLASSMKPRDPRRTPSLRAIGAQLTPIYQEYNQLSALHQQKTGLKFTDWRKINDPVFAKAYANKVANDQMRGQQMDADYEAKHPESNPDQDRKNLGILKRFNMFRGGGGDMAHDHFDRRANFVKYAGKDINGDQVMPGYSGVSGNDVAFFTQRSNIDIRNKHAREKASEKQKEKERASQVKEVWDLRDKLVAQLKGMDRTSEEYKELKALSDQALLIDLDAIDQNQLRAIKIGSERMRIRIAGNKPKETATAAAPAAPTRPSTMSQKPKETPVPAPQDAPASAAPEKKQSFEKLPKELEGSMGMVEAYQKLNELLPQVKDNKQIYDAAIKERDRLMSLLMDRNPEGRRGVDNPLVIPTIVLGLYNNVIKDLESYLKSKQAPAPAAPAAPEAPAPSPVEAEREVDNLLDEINTNASYSDLLKAIENDKQKGVSFKWGDPKVEKALASAKKEVDKGNKNAKFSLAQTYLHLANEGDRRFFDEAMPLFESAAKDDHNIVAAMLIIGLHSNDRQEGIPFAHFDGDVALKWIKTARAIGNVSDYALQKLSEIEKKVKERMQAQ